MIWKYSDFEKEIGSVFNWFKSIGIKNKNISIASNNCFAGMFYKKYGLRFNSPTVGLFIRSRDYINYLENIEKFRGALEEKLDSDEKWPVGILHSKDDSINPVIIHFQHYGSFEEASEAWKRRDERLKLDNLIAVYMHTPYTTESDLERFAALPFKRKIIIYDSTLLPNILLEDVVLIQSKAFTWAPTFAWNFALMNEEVGLKHYLK